MEALEHVRFRWAALLVAGAAVAVFAGTVTHEFVWDDAYNVVDNQAIRDLGNVPDLFVEAWGARSDDPHSRGLNTNYWRPVALTSYAVDHALFGLEPAAFHATNVWIHAVASLLVLLLGWRLFPRPGPRRLGVVLGALLFAVHPVHTEAVDVVTYRTDLLAGLFYAAALVAWLGPERGRSPGAELRTAALWVPLLYALGLGSKEMAATLPAALLLLDLLLRRPGLRGLPRVALRLLPSALVLLGYMAVRATLLEPSEYTFFRDQPGSTVAWSMLGVFTLYARLLVAPWPLNPFYDWSAIPPETSLLAPRPLVGLLLLLALFAGVAFTWRRRPRLAFLLAFFPLVLVPVSHVVPIIVAAGERFLYLASAGPLLLAGLGVASLARAVRRPVAALAPFALVLALYAGLTVARNADWRTDRTILEAYVRDWPRSFNAWYGLARLHEEEGRLDEALRIYDRLGRGEDAARLRRRGARLPEAPGDDTMAPPTDRRGRP
ncbi:MAG: hypothetical protein ACQEXJ_08045 [Myxococcota bacterium]